MTVSVPGGGPRDAPASCMRVITNSGCDLKPMSTGTGWQNQSHWRRRLRPADRLRAGDVPPHLDGAVAGGQGIAHRLGTRLCLGNCSRTRHCRRFGLEAAPDRHGKFTCEGKGMVTYHHHVDKPGSVERADIVVEATRLERPEVLIAESWFKPGYLLVTYGWKMATDPRTVMRTD